MMVHKIMGTKLVFSAAYIAPAVALAASSETTAIREVRNKFDGSISLFPSRASSAKVKASDPFNAICLKKRMLESGALFAGITRK